MKGALIAIEGTDGSGKQTQTELLKERFGREGRLCEVFAFPQYGKKSAGLVEEYLNGKYGGPRDVNPYAASLFFALDRFDVSSHIRRSLEHGTLVILDRYCDSNVGHQGGKFTYKSELDEYVKWLYNIEYRILKNPKPDLTLVLHLPAEVGQKLIAKKNQRAYIEDGKTHDIHEDDIRHLEQAESAFLWLVKKFPQTHHLIECYTDRLLSIEEIHEMIWKIISVFLQDRSDNFKD